MKRWVIGLLLAAVFVTAFFSQISFAQSCGGGKSFFHVFDESGFYEVKNVYISLHIVDENQDWLIKDFSKWGWKRQDFGETIARKYQNSKTHESFETAFEVPTKEATRLIENWIKLSEKDPQSIFAEEKDRCGNSLQGSSEFMKDERGKNLFSICTREGCSWMVLAEIQSKDYETAYFVSDFTCGCTKHYEFRLKRKRNKCLKCPN
jgi:hypothetical protein